MKTLKEFIDKYFFELDEDMKIIIEVRTLLRDLIAIVANDCRPEVKESLASFLVDARKTLGEDFSHKSQLAEIEQVLGRKNKR